VLDILFERARQGHRTIKFPTELPVLPDRFRGLPILPPAACAEGCKACVDACPTEALKLVASADGIARLQIDMGRCLFCTDCQEACPEGKLGYTAEYRLAARTREALVLRGQPYEPCGPLDRDLRKLLGRSLKLRQVSAGGCNGCEADVNVLGTIGYDLGRFGIQFVASPRHADGLLITGPVTENMRAALLTTYRAMPPPKIVIAVGACAISGGPFAGNPEVHNGADSVVPVDLYIPGCPPHPLTILDGLLSLLGRRGG
jgi:Ni,Fe-hydrogenase III small subunit/Pyruvate/2-oxoacid:ferredoxin oxidoreductase delta subunit